MSFFSWLFSIFGLDTSPESLVKRAAYIMSRGNLTAAVDMYKRAIELNPFYPAAYDGLGRVYHKMDFRTESEREFAIADAIEVWKKNPNELKAVLKLSKAMMSKGLFVQARSCLLPLVPNHSKNAEFLKTIGLCHKALNDDRRAKECLEQAIERDPKDPDLYLRLGELELKIGQKKQGAWLMEMSRQLSRVESDPNDPAVQLKAGLLFFENKKYSTAVSFLKKSIELDPQNIQAYLSLAAAHQGMNQPQAAIEILQQIIKVDPTNPSTYETLANVYSQAGDFKRARSARETAKALQAGKEGASDPGQAALYIRHLMDQGELESAQTRLAEALQRWPDDPSLQVLQGAMLFHEDRFEETIEMMQEIVKLNPQAAEPHFYMAMAYNQLKQNMNALAEGQLSTRLAPTNPEAYRILGDIYRDQDKFSLASASYETAERLAGNKNKS